MLRVYIGQLKNAPVHEFLFPNLGKKEEPNVFGETFFDSFTEPVVSLVDDASKADYLLIPHAYRSVKDDREYIDEFETLSAKLGKKVLVFHIGDSDEDVSVSNSIVFRTSQYRYKLKANEVMVPGYAHDLGKAHGFSIRRKGTKPVVGFCGWAGYGGARERFSSALRHLAADVRGALGDAHATLHKKGVYYRMKAIRALQNSPIIETNFVIRSSYSGHRKTIGSDAASARKEYVENMKRSDFILAPKGDGNFSVRFFEALSMGRVPLFLDTECPLPLEGVIDYGSFTLRVDYRDVERLPELVAEFYKRLHPQDFEKMQYRALEVFEEYLRIDIFYKYVLREEFLKKYA